MENEIAETINIADISFISDEDVIVTAGNIDIVYMDASRLTPEQIAGLEGKELENIEYTLSINAFTL